MSVNVLYQTAARATGGRDNRENCSPPSQDLHPRLSTFITVPASSSR